MPSDEDEKLRMGVSSNDSSASLTKSKIRGLGPSFISEMSVTRAEKNNDRPELVFVVGIWQRLKPTMRLRHSMEESKSPTIIYHDERNPRI